MIKYNKAYKFRIYPTKKQIEYIEGCFKACRWIYNDTLSCERELQVLRKSFPQIDKKLMIEQLKNELPALTENQLYEKFRSNLSSFGLSYHLTVYKEKYKWLKNYDAHALAYEMENLANAFKKFFNKEAGFPKFKKINDPVQSFRTRQQIKVLNNAIKIPKLNTSIETVIHREIEGAPKQMTILKKNNKYYVSIMVEIYKADVPKVLIEKFKDVGIDFGIAHFMSFDDGTKVDNPRFYDANKDYLSVLQKKLAKAVKDSNNYKKLQNKIRNLYEKITNKRKHFNHVKSKELVDDYDRFYIENLSVKKMSKSAKGTTKEPGTNVKQKSGLNRNILDAGWSEFISILTYKVKFSDKYKDIVKNKKYFASSKLCSTEGCDYVNNNLSLTDRTWTCPKCHTVHDRDTNAAKNLKIEGRKIENKKILV